MKHRNAEEFAKKLTKLSYAKIRRDYKILGEGSARIVVEYSPRIAVKIAKGEKGLYQNKAEYDLFFINAEPRLKRFLASILQVIYDGSSMTALIVRSYPKRVYSLRNKAINDQYRKCSKLLMFNDIGDNHRPSSYRRIGKTLKVVDYGFDDDSRELYGQLRRIRLHMYYRKLSEKPDNQLTEKQKKMLKWHRVLG